MTNAYRNMMERQCVSEQAKQEFYEQLQQPQGRSGRRLRTAVALAACIALLVPVTVYAVESVFGISIVELVTGEIPDRQLETGYKSVYPGLEGRPLSDFSEDIRELDGVYHAVYHSWAEAEQTIGVTLVDNPVLFGEGVTKGYIYNLRDVGLGARAHCHVVCNGKDNRLYRATITAAYHYDEMDVTLRSTVTCEHPAISKEDEYRFHEFGVLYQNSDIDEITQEQYTTDAGITANIVTFARTKGRPAQYEAIFAAKGASYRLTLHSHDPSRNEDAKENLKKILNGFIF